MKYKLNGREVTPEEWEEHFRKRQAIYGDPLAEMLQSRQAPMMANSDRMFMEGAFSQTPTHGLDELSAERNLMRARANGINTHGKVFMSQLGPPDSPLAWVSGLDDVRKSCEIQGHGCESLGIKPIDREPEPDIPLANHIVEELASERLKNDPDLRAKCRENPKQISELREQIIDKHGNHT